MLDNAKSIGKNSKFISVAEKPVDIHLFGIRTGGSLGRHKSVSHLISVNIRSVLVIGIQFFDEGI